MIFPDLSIQDFIKKHPELERALEDFKELKGINYNGAKPYYTKDVVGAIINPDSHSGRQHVFIRRA